MLIQEIIDSINREFRIYFSNSRVVLTKKLYKYIISGDNCSKALNQHDNDFHEINVINWFDDFWIYIEIALVPFDLPNKKVDSEKFPNVFVSLSVFQGKPSDSRKNQLFRAEWDNHGNSQEPHPQPHWHVYPVQYDHQSFCDVLKTLNDDEPIFTELLEDARFSLIDIKKIHFAMNGQWSSRGNHVHEINDKDTIINWLLGVLDCVRKQLEYAR